MAVNNNPRFTGIADYQGSVTITSAATTKDGTTGATLFYTAPTDGALVTGVIAQPNGTNTASVARIFLNNGSTVATATNNIMVAQVSLPGTTNSEIAAIPTVWIPIPRPFQDMKATHRLYVAIGTTVSAGWQFSAAASGFTA